MQGDIRFFWWSKCSTCRNARAALQELGVAFVEREFFRDPLTESELREICRFESVENVFSWASPSARKYRERRDEMTDAELVELMLSEPRLIRRPLLMRGDELIIGFRQDEYRRFAAER